MNRTRKRFSLTLVLALTFALLLGGSGLVYAQEQIVTMGDPLTVAKNATFDVTFTYNVSDADNTLGALGFAICYDSTKVSYVQGSYVSLSPNAEAFRQPPTLIGSLGAAVDDTKNIGEFGATSGKLLPIMYGAPDGKFPNTTLPLQLFKITFAALDVDGNTSIKIKQVATATGYTIPDSAVTVTVGTAVITPIPMDIIAAAAAIEATDPVTTVVDANTADYANQHIAGAVTADAVPADKNANILVYCREIAKAQELAQSLIDQGYTKVAYLDATFAAFAADTTNVTNDMVQYKLTVTTSGTGTVTANPVSADGFYNRNTPVTLTADPTTVAWSGDTTDGTVTMTAIKTVTATFAGAVNTPPVANDFSFEIPVGGQYSGKLVGTDDDTGDILTYIKVTDPSQGTLEVYPDGTFTYDDPTTAGTVTFTFKVNDGKDDSTPAIVTITVKSPFQCDLTAAVINPPASGKEPLDVALSVNVTGTADTYVWNVTKDGVSVKTGSASTLNLTALAAGVYTATLTVSNSAIANCSVVADPVTINVTADQCDLTAAVIIPNPESGKEPLDVALSANVTGTADTYVWNVTRDGVSVKTGSASTLNLTALTAGVYTATLTVSNSAIANCSANAYPVTINVTADQCDLTSAVINASTYGGVEPLNVALSAAVTGTADTYSWTVTGASGTVATGTNATLNLTALMAGNYTVYLKVSNSAIQNCSVNAGTALIQVSQSSGEPDGDGDCNNVVDIYDALLAAIIDVGNPDNVVVCDEAMLDVDQNGSVDINDALAIAKYDVGLNCNCVLDAKK